MARRRQSWLTRMQQSAAQTERARMAQQRSQLAWQRAQQRALRQAELQQERNERTAKRLLAEMHAQEAADKTAELNEQVSELQGHLIISLRRNPTLDFASLKPPPVMPVWTPGKFGDAAPRPVLESLLPARPHGMAKLRPGATAKYEAACIAARAAYEVALQAWQEQENARQAEISVAWEAHEGAEAAAKAEAQEAALIVDEFERVYRAGDPALVSHYAALVLERSPLPDGFPTLRRIAYSPPSRQLVVEVELPTKDVVPREREFRYVRSRDAIEALPRPERECRSLYLGVIAQTTLRTLSELFRADAAGLVDTAVINGYVSTVNPATGQNVRPCLITLRATRDVLAQLDLARVDPVACLKQLNAGVSASPAELAPVRPVLEFNMVDPRFIEETDILSTLDERPNLMEISPGDFETLITNLFEKMGLETKLTRPSRDGGVDCVAYDSRPIVGGKVVIQAKRYKNTVGVSAVRDLWGTTMNEGASKGILVTTSGYGKASFEFASNKPLELLDGSNLLALLADHAGINAKIEAPDDWVDPIPSISD
jgi:restriction system protein